VVVGTWTVVFRTQRRVASPRREEISPMNHPDQQEANPW